ncbi:uncharacterized protein SCHCODRAFT_02620209 [Schizophyllum commune H4-8]|uniref:uncharacterized protein n=1 Tax=Schizophyllum commune (strain H4-8 / FGSC 9210) TaxID=578458 RepID=UPI00215DE5C9|nr:uncharacterized protein SCHCODRAFT_02620209 [Schizophyllum commune H4-8]KAI5895726.1 hypothetical protein SCHCODRAFT_02620209 [Schizophyllum commune H4-8]
MNYARKACRVIKICYLGLHCRSVGRPARLAGLRKFIEYSKSTEEGVWFATREEIAKHWIERFPYKVNQVASKFSEEKGGRSCKSNCFKRCMLAVRPALGVHHHDEIEIERRSSKKCEDERGAGGTFIGLSARDARVLDSRTWVFKEFEEGKSFAESRDVALRLHR